MSKRDYRKLVIPKDDYLATIVHANYGDGEHNRNKFYLWWTVDTGKYIGQKISTEYPCTEFGDMLLNRMCTRIKTSMRGSVAKMSTIFPLQFCGYRGKISVDIKHEGNFTRNIITYHQVALSPPEENVIKSRSIDHFYQEQVGRKLPI